MSSWCLNLTLRIIIWSPIVTSHSYLVSIDCTHLSRSSQVLYSFTYLYTTCVSDIGSLRSRISLCSINHMLAAASITWLGVVRLIMELLPIMSSGTNLPTRGIALSDRIVMTPFCPCSVVNLSPLTAWEALSTVRVCLYHQCVAVWLQHNQRRVSARSVHCWWQHLQCYICRIEWQSIHIILSRQMYCRCMEWSIL